MQVSDTSYRHAVVTAICDDPDYAAGTAKVLVFAGDTTSADSLSELLQEEGLRHVVYHKNRPLDERNMALEVMSQPSPQVCMCGKRGACRVGGRYGCSWTSALRSWR